MEESDMHDINAAIQRMNLGGGRHGQVS